MRRLNLDGIGQTGRGATMFLQSLSVVLVLGLAATAWAEPVGLDEEFSLSGNTTTMGFPNDGLPTVTYDAATGDVIMDPDGNSYNSFVLDSVAGIFTGAAPVFATTAVFNTDTDIRIAQNFMAATISTVHNLGPVAQTGLTKAFLLNDLTLQGGLAGNPNFLWDLIVINEVAEPAAVILAMIALAAFGGYAVRVRRLQAVA